jgi:hypothetical protein
VANCVVERFAGRPNVAPPLSRTTPGKPVSEHLAVEVFLNRMVAN